MTVHSEFDLVWKFFEQCHLKSEKKQNGGNDTYDLNGFFHDRLNGKCLKQSILLIPTNIRCSEVKKYTFFWNFISTLDNDALGFLNKNELDTFIIWMNYGHLSPTDTKGCDLGYLLKKPGARMSTLPSEKNSAFLTENAPLAYCSRPPRARPVSKGLLIAVVSISVAVVLLLLIIAVLVFRRYNHKKQQTPRNINEWVQQQQGCSSDTQ
ncbi:hypothetical protein M3Y99_00652400 [Aphelenchoides fujianensis]|nr:hypothetical protein M3Y99_00652400 [Aphelenchoides fujianensis]